MRMKKIQMRRSSKSTGETKSLLTRFFKPSYRRSTIQIYLLSPFIFFHTLSSSTFLPPPLLLLLPRAASYRPASLRPVGPTPGTSRGRVTPARASRRPSSTCGSGRILSCPHRSPSALPSVASNRRRHLQLPPCRRHGFPHPSLAPTTVVLRLQPRCPPPASSAGSMPTLPL
jgi:hypothetical protein